MGAAATTVSEQRVTLATRPAPRRAHAIPDEAQLALALPFHGVELAATGGMSLVYRAEDRTRRQRVAVKLLRPALVGHRGIEASFAAELEVSRRIRHPGIVAVHELAAALGVPYLVLDWVDGSTLSDAGPLSVVRIADIGVQVAEALAAAHAAGVVHCDLKPDNILLARGTVRLIDFGMARLPGRPRLAADVVSGTPLYMAPEQWRGVADASSDIYALGCVLYELLAGRAPFTGNFAQVMTAHLEHSPDPLRDLPPALDELVLSMLAKAPDARPSSMTEVAARLSFFASR